MMDVCQTSMTHMYVCIYVETRCHTTRTNQSQHAPWNLKGAGCFLHLQGKVCMRVTEYWR